MNLYILDAGILIMVQQVRLIMFSLKMVNYPITFLMVVVVILFGLGWALGILGPPPNRKMKKQNTKTRLVHPELNLSILDAGILIMVFVTSKFDDILLEYGGLPHVLPLAVHLFFFCAEQVEQAGSN